MTVFEVCVMLAGFCTGLIVVGLYYYFLNKSLQDQIEKLRKQVFYWSRQMPLNRRPKKKSVKK